MQIKNIIICGAGGQGKEVEQLIRNINEVKPTWNLIGYIDDDCRLTGTSIHNVRVLGDTNLICNPNYDGVYIVCAIGNPKVKQRMVTKLKKVNSTLHYATLIHPSAVVSDYCKIGEGCIISANTLVSVDCSLGEHILINYGSSIGHDTEIGDYSSVYPGARLSGNVIASKCTEIGANATILPGIVVGKESRVGAGAVVTKSIPNNCTVVGVPAELTTKESLKVGENHRDN